MEPAFSPVQESDYRHIRDIFNYYVENTTVTFATLRHTLNDIKKDYPVSQNKYRTYMISYEGDIAGFCFLKPYKLRKAYDRTALIGVYLKPGYERMGIGSSALGFLEKTARDKNIKVLLGYITAENNPSIRLVEKLGYVKCGHFRKIGEKFGRILDVVYYQKKIAA